MKSREIWEMTPGEIQGNLDDAYGELFNLRFQFSTGQMQNSARLAEMRREIARLKYDPEGNAVAEYAGAGCRMKERKRVLVGRVLSNRMDKTAIVVVERKQRHRLYGKVITMRKKYKAHDAENSCQIGDMVKMIESRPLSREKRWVVTEILERA